MATRMTLQELVERLTSHPLYQAGKAADVEVHVDTRLFPLATRHIEGVSWVTHDGKDYLVLGVTGYRPGPMAMADFGKLISGSGREVGGEHPA